MFLLSLLHFFRVTRRRPNQIESCNNITFANWQFLWHRQGPPAFLKRICFQSWSTFNTGWSSAIFSLQLIHNINKLIAQWSAASRHNEITILLSFLLTIIFKCEDGNFVAKLKFLYRLYGLQICRDFLWIVPKNVVQLWSTSAWCVLIALEMQNEQIRAAWLCDFWATQMPRTPKNAWSSSRIFTRGFGPPWTLTTHLFWTMCKSGPLLKVYLYHRKVSFCTGHQLLTWRRVIGNIECISRHFYCRVASFNFVFAIFIVSFAN